MIYISNKNKFLKHLPYIQEFTLLYNMGFPDINERENIELIYDRIKGIKEKYDPNTILILYPIDDKICAGLIADCYIESKCIHLTYLIVSATNRNQGIAKALINDGVHEIIKTIKKKYKTNIEAVFFESNIPSKTVHDSFDPLSRLFIFSKLGAKLINIPYIQPALDSNKKKVDNLYLLTFPISDTNKDHINIEIIINFLLSLYKSLLIENPYENDDFIKMVSLLEKQKDVSNYIQLLPIPLSRD